MFTGIVEETGAVEALLERQGGWHLTVRGQAVLGGTRVGDSIAVNGVCLTVTHLAGSALTFGLAPETLARTNLGALKPGERVNLERSLAADGRIGGHFVQGHIDGTGCIASRDAEGDSLRMAVQAAPELLRYMVPKGYIAVDGASLTLIDVTAELFTFMLIAFTRQVIALAQKPVGSLVNVEVDVMAKYAEKFIRAR